MERTTMDTIALHTVLRAGRERAYDDIHRTIPGDVAVALRTHGVRNWRIWRDGRDVFHLVEVDDYAAMRVALRDLPANIRWQAAVSPFFDRPDDYAGNDPVAGRLWSLAEQLQI